MIWPGKNPAFFIIRLQWINQTRTKGISGIKVNPCPPRFCLRLSLIFLDDRRRHCVLCLDGTKESAE